MLCTYFPINVTAKVLPFKFTFRTDSYEVAEAAINEVIILLLCGRTVVNLDSKINRLVPLTVLVIQSSMASS